MTADRPLQRLARLEIAAGQGPTALERRACALPQQDLQHAVTHLQDDREAHMSGSRVRGGTLAQSFRPIVANLSGKVRNEEIARASRRGRPPRRRLWRWRRQELLEYELSVGEQDQDRSRDGHRRAERPRLQPSLVRRAAARTE